jgi:hypothetical protein
MQRRLLAPKSLPQYLELWPWSCVSLVAIGFLGWGSVNSRIFVGCSIGDLRGSGH